MFLFLFVQGLVYLLFNCFYFKIVKIFVGKRVEENENELQESAKKQKRDEVAEEQRKKDEIVSYYSFLDPETDMVFI